MDIMRQSARLVVNPITVDSYSFLFNCSTVGQVSALIFLIELNGCSPVGQASGYVAVPIWELVC